MALPRRSALAAGTLLALAVAACSDEESSGSGSSTSRTPSTTSGTTPSASSTSTSADPTVDVTASPDPTQPADARDAGLADVDDGAEAISLAIPAVGLRTPLEAQGLRGGVVNPRPGQVIWFTGYERVRPGATGTSVLAGHVVSGGAPDRFAALEQLEVGDGVVLGYPSGTEVRFEVTSTDIVDKQELTSDPSVWGRNDDTRRIVLITCDDRLGFREDGHRTANFVAVAELPD